MKGDSEHRVPAPARQSGADCAEERGVLVVWYSHSGRTEQVGEELARLLRADREPIRALVPHEGPGSRLRARWERLLKRPAPIRPMRFRPADYRLVLVGTPVSRDGLAAPVRSYLMNHAAEFRQVAFFGVARTADAADSAFDDMQRLCGGQAVPRLWCRLGTYGGGDPIEGLREFIDALRGTPAAPVAPGTDVDELAPAQGRARTSFPECWA